MARTGHSVTILTSTGDVVPNAPIEIRLYSTGGLANIFEQDGTQITQLGATADENGIFRFWAEPNEYLARHSGVDVPVTVGVDTKSVYDDLSLAHEVSSPSKLLSDSILFPEGKIISINERKGGFFVYTIGGTANGFEVLDAGNGNTAVAKLGAPIIDTHIGIIQGSPDSYNSLVNGQSLALERDTKVELTVRGTYRTSGDLNLNAFTGAGWITLDGWDKNNIVDRTVKEFNRPYMIENSSDNHVGGEGRYTAFFGGAAFQGSKVFFARNGAGHISSPTKISRYLIDEVGRLTKGVLKDTNGVDMTFQDFRDPNLGLQRSLTQGPVLSGSELVSPGVYQHYFLKLNVGGFDVNTVYSVSGIPSDEFMWGNAVHSRDEFWLKCTYGISGANLNVVHLYKATGNGSDPVSWVKIKDSLFTNASECTLCYWEGKLVAITRSEPQTDPMQMRWTYDQEGVDGWSEVITLPFSGAAPSVIPYIPKGDSIVLHASVIDESSGYRVPVITSTPNLIDWTNISSGQFKNFTGSGAYGALVSDKNGYSMMYYEEVGAVDDKTRVWYVDINTQSRVYPNDDLVKHVANLGDRPVESCLLPNGKACLGDLGSTSRFFSSSSNGSYLEVMPKRDIEISAFASVMSAPATVSTSVTVYGGAINITSPLVSINSTSPKVFEFPMIATLKVGVTYRFTFNVNAELHGRRTNKSAFNAIDEDYTNYHYIKTNIEGSNYNEFVISHGFVY